MPLHALLRCGIALALSGAAAGHPPCQDPIPGNPDDAHCVNCAAKGKCKGMGGNYCTDVCPPNYQLDPGEHGKDKHCNQAGIYCNKKGKWELNSDRSRAVCVADDCGPHNSTDAHSDFEGPA